MFWPSQAGFRSAWLLLQHASHSCKSWQPASGNASPSCIALFCFPLLSVALHCFALLCFVFLHCIAFRCVALLCIAFVALHCFTLHCLALHCLALHCLALHCLALRFIALLSPSLSFAFCCVAAVNFTLGYRRPMPKVWSLTFQLHNQQGQFIWDITSFSCSQLNWQMQINRQNTKYTILNTKQTKCQITMFSKCVGVRNDRYQVRSVWFFCV